MQTIIVDGRRWGVEFSGFSSPLRAFALDDGRVTDGAHGAPSTTPGPELRLRPWTYPDHLRTLREHLRFGPSGLDLDSERYADAVLDHATMTPPTPRTAEARASEEGPNPGARRALALWWASGLAPGGEPEDDHPSPDHGGWLELGEGRSVRLRGLTWGGRLAAQRAALSDAATDHGLHFDSVAYLDSMVRGCVVEVSPAQDLALAFDALDARATRRLLSAVTDLNHPAQDDDPLLGIPPQLAASTLRLCASMGWTLERVLATPAVEVSRLLTLIDAVEGSSSRAPPLASRSRRAPSSAPSSRLADHPDAVVLVFGDGGDTP